MNREQKIEIVRAYVDDLTDYDLDALVAHAISSDPICAAMASVLIDPEK